MLQKRRLLVILIGLTLLVSACGSNAGDKSKEQANGEPPFSISMTLPLHQTKVPDNQMLQAIEQAAGATLDIDWVPNDNYRDKMISELETNSLKMVTIVNQPDYVSVKNSIRSGMFWNIGPYLDSYPNLKKLNKSILNDISVDGKIYGLYSERPASRQGVILRKDWLDKLHLQEPGSIDELYNVMKQFTLGDPDGNGVQDTIGLAERSDLVFGGFKTFASYFGTPNNWGNVNGKLVPDFMTPEYVDTMNFMKKLYNEGLVNSDFAITTKQIQRYMMITGKAGVYVGSIDDAPRMQDEMKKINPKAELTVVNRISGPKGYGIWSIPGYSSVLLFSKKVIKSEDELKAVLAFFDRTMNADCANLLAYGIPGKAYEVKNGKALLKPEMSDYRNNEVLPFLGMMVANLSNPNILKADDASKDPLTLKTDRLIADNDSFLIRDPAQNLFSPTYDAKGAELSQIISDATDDYILGHIDLAGFQKAVTEWQDKGGSQIMKEYNEDNH